jgi:hypothetical protein
MKRFNIEANQRVENIPLLNYKKRIDDILKQL